MAVDNDRVILYTEEDVKKILAEFSDREKAEKIFENKDEELDFVRLCLKHLDDGEKDIIEKTFFEGVSIRKYALYSGFSRNFITRQRDKSIKLLAKFFNVKFG